MRHMVDKTDEISTALGRLVEKASNMEWAMQSVFCILVNSKMAAVVAARHNLEALVDDCVALASVCVSLGDLTPEQGDQVQVDLAAVRAASKHRNEMIHGMWVTHWEDQSRGQLLAPRRGYTVRKTRRSASEVVAVADEVTWATNNILTSMRPFPDERRLIDTQLRRELPEDESLPNE